MPWSTVALDASVLINLEATGRAAEIATALGVRFVIPPQVAQEALLIDIPVDDGIERRRRGPSAWGSALTTVELDERELDEFVRLAHVLGDGEAATIAVAVVRRLPVAMDDRRALREVQRLGLEAVHTTDLLVHWERGGTPHADVVTAVRRIEERAHFRPPRSDPHFEWWAERSPRSARP